MKEISNRLGGLYTAVVADVLDALDYRHQCLGPRIRALTAGRQICGRVFTARAIAVSEIPARPYQLEMEAIERMEEGEVLVVGGDGNEASAFWGELLTTASVAKGLRGVVMNACCRDMWQLHGSRFPVFGIGSVPTDSLGRVDVAELQGVVEIDGVAVTAGDWILGDLDGVVVIPGRLIEEVIGRAEDKRSGENEVRDDLARGMPISEAFQKHGIL